MRHIPGESQLTAWRKGQATRQGPGSPNRAKGQVEPVGRSKGEERGQKEKPRDLRRLPPEYASGQSTLPSSRKLSLAPSHCPWQSPRPKAMAAQSPSTVGQVYLSRGSYKWHHTVSLLWGRGGFFCSPQSFVALISDAFRLC